MIQEIINENTIDNNTVDSNTSNNGMYGSISLEDTNGIVYSIDKLIIKFRLNEEYEELFYNHFNKDIFPKLRKIRNVDYKKFYSIQYEDNNSPVYIGYSQINKIDTRYNGCIIINPNNHIDNIDIVKDMMFIASISNRFYISLYDLAIDVPIAKSNVHFDKVGRYGLNIGEYIQDDEENALNKLVEEVKSGYMYDLLNRVKSTLNKSKVITEYLGTFDRHNEFSFKLYDKKAEAKLSNELTRIETTHRFKNEEGFNIEMIMQKYRRSQENNINSGLPTVYVQANKDIQEDAFFRHNENYIRMINESIAPFLEISMEKNPKKRQQLKEYINFEKFVYNFDAIEELLTKLQQDFLFIKETTLEDIINDIALSDLSNNASKVRGIYNTLNTMRYIISSIIGTPITNAQELINTIYCLGEEYELAEQERTLFIT